MRTTDVSYTRRYKTGEYEFEEFSVNAVLDETGDDDATESLVELKTMVSMAQGAELKSATLEVVEPKKTRGKAAKPAPEPEPEEEEVEEEVVEEEEIEEEAEEEVEEEPAKKVGEVKGGKKLKKKGSTYSRSNEVHKGLFAEHLNAVYPKWKKSDEAKAKAKKLSQSLDGKDFLDADGEVVESFKAEIKKVMKAYGK